MNMERTLNTSVQNCCGASLLRLERSSGSGEGPGGPPAEDEGGVPEWAFILVGVIGALVLLGLVVLAVLWCVKKNGTPKRNERMYYQPESGSRDNLGYVK